MHHNDPVSLIYYYHPIHHRDGRASAQQAACFTHTLNPNPRDASNLLIAEQLFNDGDLDALMARFEPKANPDDARECEEIPFAIGFAENAESVAIKKRLTGMIFMNGDFPMRNVWPDERDFWRYLRHMHNKNGYSIYTTVHDVNVRFTMCSDDGKTDMAMKRGENGLWHQIYPHDTWSPKNFAGPLEAFRLNLGGGRDFTPSAPNDHLMPN